MRTGTLGCVVVGLTLLASFTEAPQAAGQAPAAPAGADRSAHRAVLEAYCVTCHNTRLRTGGLVLDTLGSPADRANAAIWEQVVRKLRLGVMPPQGARRPDAGSYHTLIEALETELDRAAAARITPGRPLLRRLNRSEYANAIHDLLGLDVDVASLLPPDDAAFGFDNVADVQANSPSLLQAYLAAARKISALASGDRRTAAGSQIYVARQDLSQDQPLEGLPLGTVGGLRAKHLFPLDAEYELQIKLFRTNLNAIRGLEDPQELELTVDGERMLLVKLGGADDLVALQKNPTDASDGIETKRLRLRTFVKAGPREIAAAFLEKPPPVLETNRLQRFVRDFANPYDAEGAPHVQSITVLGPYQARESAPPPRPAILRCRRTGAGDAAPAAAKASARSRRSSLPIAANEGGCARQIISTLARRAFRRPVAAAEVNTLVAFYQTARAEGSFDTAIQLVLRRILASPSFVFRPETEPATAVAGTTYRVSASELASRLSFFLWSSIPDEELLRLGENGTLHRPDVLAGQVRRMLADARADSLVRNFAGQWLQLRNLRGIVPDPETFPDFDDNLRQSFLREAELFFGSMIREDRNVLDLLTAGDTFMDERLARHYGVSNVFGSHFRRVQQTDDRRRGLLGKGAVLLVTSHATTTSPVLRGKWVLDNLLGAPPPPPPADVPPLKDDSGAAPLTKRQQMERHRTDAVCASCHKTMDPIGFALENFDVVGAWRDTNEAGVRLDTADVLADGARIDGVSGLRQALLNRSDLFVQTLTEKLMIYALGRGLTPDDMPVVRGIVRDARRHGYRFSTLMLGIASSVPFQMRIATRT